MKNCQRRGFGLSTKAEGSIDNTTRSLVNSRYYVKTEFNNYFIMYSKPRNKEQHRWNTRTFHANLIHAGFSF